MSKNNKVDEYANININVIENGFLVTLPAGSNIRHTNERCIRSTDVDQQLVFKTPKELMKWLSEHMAPSGEKRKFLNDLDEYDNGTKAATWEPSFGSGPQPPTGLGQILPQTTNSIPCGIYSNAQQLYLHPDGRIKSASDIL